MFSDISSDEDVLEATQLLEQEYVLFPDEELSQKDIDLITPLMDSQTSETDVKHSSAECSRFHSPVSTDDLLKVQSSRIPKKTSDKALWAVSLFGEWRATRNLKCIEGESNCDIYINVPFAQMTEDQLLYTLPRFICEIKKKMVMIILLKVFDRLLLLCKNLWK